MSSSLKTVLILNIFVLLIGLTPIYTFLSGGFRLLSRPPEVQLARFNSNLLSGLTFAVSLPKIYGENQSLKNEVATLRESLAGYLAVALENEMLRSQLSLGPAARAGKLVLARVLGLNRDESTMVLDAGRQDGVAPGNLVTYKGQLLGKIINVDQERSTLLLTVSPQSRFEAVTGALSARGEVVGEFGNRLTFTKILPTQPVSAGESVLEFGSRLILGKVDKVEKEGAKIFKEASILVLYDPLFLTEVFVVKP